MISSLGDFSGNLSFSLILLYIFLFVNLQAKRVKQYSHFLVLQKYVINARQLFFLLQCARQLYHRIHNSDLCASLSSAREPLPVVPTDEKGWFQVQ